MASLLVSCVCLLCGDGLAQPHAESAHGAWRAVVSGTPPQLALIDATGVVRQRHRVATLQGRNATAVAALWNLPLRRSFLLAPADLPEWWEVSYDPQAEPLYDGLVHDYRMGEAIAQAGFLGVRRIPLDAPLSPVMHEPARHTVWGVPADAAGGAQTAQVIQLDVRRRIGTVPWVPPPSAPEAPTVTPTPP